MAKVANQPLVSHAGLSALTSFLNALDFRSLCEDRFSQLSPVTAAPTRKNPRSAGSVAGGEQATDSNQLRASPEFFGSIASDATVSRFMSRIKDQPEAFAYGFATRSLTFRTRAWAVAGPRNTGRRATASNPLIIDMDASLVHVYSKEESSAGTCKGGNRFSQLMAMYWVDEAEFSDAGGEPHRTWMSLRHTIPVRALVKVLQARIPVAQVWVEYLIRARNCAPVMYWVGGYLR